MAHGGRPCQEPSLNPSPCVLFASNNRKYVFFTPILTFSNFQISLVPWTLYHNSRPRRRSHPRDESEDPHRQLASSELRTIEIFFLSLTVISPFLGAIFLRYVIAAISGTDALSWFSTGLFILATGMRPWRHLAERFNQRTHELHDVIHYPPTPDKTQIEILQMRAQISQLEKLVVGLRAKLADTADDLYLYVDDTVDNLKTSSRKHEKEYERQEARLKDVEESIAGLRKGKEKDKRLSVNTNLPPHTPLSLTSCFPSWLGLSSSPPATHRARFSTQSTPSKHPIRSYPSSSSMRLESIPEEEAKSFHDTKSPRSPRSFQLRIPGFYLILRWGDLATLPLRRVVQYLLT
jgi:hypothetical protein